MPHSNLDRYILKGGIDGSARLKILAEALRPSTEALLARMGPLDGLHIVDAASGGGDVSLMLARLAGSSGQVTGFDLDAAILTVASKRAAEESATNLRFMVADVTKPWLANHVDLVYARFILTHLAEPEAMLAQARAALVPGGRIVIEDIDSDGVFWDPASAAMEKLMEIYRSVSKARGGDPLIGRRLHRLLSDNGFADVQTHMVHPHGRSGPAKISPALIGPSISDAAVCLGAASRAEMDKLNDELFAFANHPETTVAMPRVFQAWAAKA
jgi:ubiquinone/menaquinone biosynthesis C-methylase UbiE